MCAYSDYNDVATVTEEMFRDVAQKALGRTVIKRHGEDIDLVVMRGVQRGGAAHGGRLTVGAGLPAVHVVRHQCGAVVEGPLVLHDRALGLAGGERFLQLGLGFGQRGVDLAVPVHVGTEARRHAVPQHLDHAAEGVAGAPRTFK